MRSLLTFFVASFLLMPIHGMAEDVYEEEGAQIVDDAPAKPDTGWYWYEKDKAPAPKKSMEQVPPVAGGSGSPSKSPFSVAWLREMMPKLLDKAIDEPTPENLQAYLYVQRVYLDKSQRYAEAAQQTVFSEPLLDENNRMPVASYGKDKYIDEQNKAKDDALRLIAKEKAGLFVFFDSKCKFCVSQFAIVEMLVKKYGFIANYISMDGKGLPGMKRWVPDNGISKKLEVKIYPTTVLAAPPNTFLVVSQGVMTRDDLSRRILVASEQAKLIPAGMVKNINPQDAGVLTTEDLKDGATDDPAQLVKNIKEKLKNRY